MNTFTKQLGINDFVRRQTAESEFSHYVGTLEELLLLAHKHWPVNCKGDETVVFVTVPVNDDFFCGVVKVNKDTVLRSHFGVRDKGEEPHVIDLAYGAEKVLGVETTLVFVSHDELAKKNEQTHKDIAFELVSINVEEEKGKKAPKHPRTMARDHLDKPGGTLTKFTADQFAESIDYWKDRVMNGGVL